MKAIYVIGAATLAIGTAAVLTHGQADPSAQPAAPQAVPGAPMVVLMNQNPPTTHLDATLAARGSLVVRGYTEIGTVLADDGSGISVAAVELTDATRGQRDYGLAVGVRQAGRPSLAVVTNLDADEIDALMAAADQLGKLDATVTPLSAFEGRYKSKADLELSNFADNSGSRLIAIRGVQTFPESGLVSFATCYFPLSRLPDLKQLLATGKQTLDKARNAANAAR